MRAVLLVVAATAGCAPQPLPFEEVADMKQLMTSVIEPRTEEQWIAVRDAAYVIAESGNLLLMPSRLQDGDEWPTLVGEYIDVARAALAAAEARDAQAVFDAGGEVYLVCSRCHEAFAPDTLRPNFDPGVVRD